MATMPHCDQRVLHAPGECEYCDAWPAWQEARQMWGVAFTGHPPKESELPCPSTVRRDLDTINRWPGNRPARHEEPSAEEPEPFSENWWSAHSPTQLGRPNIPVLRRDLEAMVREIVQVVLRGERRNGRDL